MKKIVLILAIAAFMATSCSSGSGEKKPATQKKESVAKPEKVAVQQQDLVKLEPGERAILKYTNGQPQIVLKFVKEGDKETVVYRKEFFENGQISKEGPMENGQANGAWKSYYKTGEIWSEGSYLKGRNNGPVTAFYKSGKVKYKGQYKNGKRSGVWKFFNERGDLTETKNY